MSELVVELREKAELDESAFLDICAEAADAIEPLRKKVRKLKREIGKRKRRV